MPRSELQAKPHATRTILGVPFFQGNAAEAVGCTRHGGLVLVPAAPALREITTNSIYREALLKADFVLPDSAFMVLVWNWLERDHISRLSGLGYLRELLSESSFRQAGNTLWVMPTLVSSERNIDWLRQQGIDVPPTHVYLAPIYDPSSDGHIVDPRLVEWIEELQPQHIVLALGGGTQEPLGLYLRQSLSYLPAIHCIGAAIAFLSGDQVLIPVWADTYYLGWLFRILSQPRRFSKRYWQARKLFVLLKEHRDALPPMAL